MFGLIHLKKKKKYMLIMNLCFKRAETDATKEHESCEMLQNYLLETFHR